MKYLKTYEMKNVSFKSLKFNEIREWEEQVEKIQIELEPALNNDDDKLLDEIIKKYKFDINEFLFYKYNPANYKNNILQEQLERIAMKSHTEVTPKMNVIKYLIDNNADINMFNKFGDTPLLIFLNYSGSQSYGQKSNEKYNVQVVDYLLKNNADPTISEKNRFQTPLTYCTSHTGLKLVKLLIKYGADPYFGEKYDHSEGSYLYTPYRAYFNNNNLDKLIYLITEYDINPFEMHKNLIFNGTAHSNGNFFDYFLGRLPADDKKKHEYIKSVFPKLQSYKFQKYLIDKYGTEGIKKILIIGPNTEIINEYDHLPEFLTLIANNYNL